MKRFILCVTDYAAVCSETTDWFMYVMSEINDPSNEVKVRFMKKSNNYCFAKTMFHPLVCQSK